MDRFFFRRIVRPSLTLGALQLGWVAILQLAACGGESVEEKLNRQVNEAVGGVVERAAGVKVDQASLDSMLEGFGGSLDSVDLGKLKSGPVIGFRELKPLMPETVAGLARTEHLGETNGVMGFNISEATAVYGEGERRVDAKLLDTGGAGVLLLSMAGFAKYKVDKETADGSERTFTLDGYPAHEKYSAVGGKTTSSLNVLVNDRFVVSLDGQGVDAAALTAGFRAFRLKDLPMRAGK